MADTRVGSIYWEAQLRGVQKAMQSARSLNTQLRRLALSPVQFQVGVTGTRQVTQATSALQALGRTAAQALQSVGRLSGQILKGLGGIPGAGIRGLWGLGGLVNSLGNVVRRFGDTLVHFGQIGSVFSYRLSLLVAPLFLMATQVGKLGMKFEENLAWIATQLDLGGDAMEKFTSDTRRYLLDLSEDIPITVDDMAESLYYLVSSLTIPPETARAMIEPLAKAAIAGKATAREVAEAGTVILNVYDHILEEADGTVRLVSADIEGAIPITEASSEKVARAITHMTDVMLLAVQRGRAEFGDFANQIGDFALEAELAGVSLEEMLAVYAEATRVTTPSMAATWVSNIFRRFTDPKFFESLRSYGIEIENIAEGTGRWETHERKLTEAQQDRVRSLEDTIIRSRTTLDRYIGTAESTWADYTEGLQLYIDTQYVRQGIDTRAVSSFLTWKKATEDLTKVQAEGTGTYREWIGELRPGIDILIDFAEAVSNIEDEEQQLKIIHEAFPSARSTRGVLVWLKNVQEITEWTREWEKATGETQEDFEIMMATGARAFDLFINRIKRVGYVFYENYQDRIKVTLDAIGQLALRLKELPPEQIDLVVKLVGALVALAPIALILGTLFIGLGTAVTAIGSLITAPTIGIGIGLWAIFGKQLKGIFDAIGGYNISSFRDVASFLVDMAVQLGLIKERDVRDILESFGVEIGKLGDPNVTSAIDNFKEMWGKIVDVKDDAVVLLNSFGNFLKDLLGAEDSSIWGLWNAFITKIGEGQDDVEKVAESLGKLLASVLGAEDTTFFSIFEAFLKLVSDIKDDFLIWVDAFGILLKNIEERKGGLGTIVGLMERLWEKVIKPFIGWSGKEYGEAPAEERAGWLDKLLTGLLVAWAAGKVVSLAAAMVNVAAGVVTVVGGRVIGGGITPVPTGGQPRTPYPPQSYPPGYPLPTTGQVVAGTLPGLALTTLGAIGMSALFSWLNPILDRWREQNLPEWYNKWAKEAKSREVGGEPLGMEFPTDWFPPGWISDEDVSAQQRYLKALADEFATKTDIAALGYYTGGPTGVVGEEEPPLLPEDPRLKVYPTETEQALGEEVDAIREQIRVREAQIEQAKVMLRQAAFAEDEERYWELLGGRQAPPLPLSVLTTPPETGAEYQLLTVARLKAETRLAELDEELALIVTGREGSQADFEAGIGGATDALKDGLEPATEDTTEVMYTMPPALRRLRDAFNLAEKAGKSIWKWVQDTLGAAEKPTGGISSEADCIAAGGTWVNGECILEGFQRGGIVPRNTLGRLHRGEVIFNPRYPRQDLARVVNAAMAGIGGGYGGTSVALTPTVNIGTFAGTQTEMNQLQRMLENMSFDMAMRVERKLAEARRVESRRRE